LESSFCDRNVQWWIFLRTCSVDCYCPCSRNQCNYNEIHNKMLIATSLVHSSRLAGGSACNPNNKRQGRHFSFFQGKKIPKMYFFPTNQDSVDFPKKFLNLPPTFLMTFLKWFTTNLPENPSCFVIWLIFDPKFQFFTISLIKISFQKSGGTAPTNDVPV